MVKILWVDDEIELLKPHILFLKSKGYEVDKCSNGTDALELIKETRYEAVLLDENMPGISGLEALTQMKLIAPDMPVIMITKSEEEHIMEDAIGSQIADYLIKPVNSSQILLSLKKNLDAKQLMTEKTVQNYQQEFRQLSIELMDVNDYKGWESVYRKLVYWELELAKSGDTGMDEMLSMQKRDANNAWSKFVAKHFIDFIKKPTAQTPLMSHKVLAHHLPHLLKSDCPVFLVVIDNFRYDQWKLIQNALSEFFNVVQDEMYMTILPTTTHYARNSLFAGMMPAEIEKKHPNLWVNEEDEEGKNLHEEALLANQLNQFGYTGKFSFKKVTHLGAGKELIDQIPNMFNNPFNVIVYNFVDMLSHVRTEMNVMKELAEDEAAYRSITASWFEHSPLFEALKKIAAKKAKLIITTDHGSIRVQNPVKVIGDKSTSTNLRYKQGKSLTYNEKELFAIRKPEDAQLPKQFMSSTYVFAQGEDFMVYPNNYNYHVNMYANSFQHGGISLEEMLVPFITLETK
jgi:CheY-like chemotaxis protein